MSSDIDVNEEMNSLTAIAENLQHDDKNNDHLKFDKKQFYKDSVKIMQKMQKKLKHKFKDSKAIKICLYFIIISYCIYLKYLSNGLIIIILDQNTYLAFMAPSIT